MKIRDIVNRDIVNLENCEQEPIHIPGSIQPQGFMLAIYQDSYVIDFCSENVSGFLSLSHKQLLGKSFTDVFGEANESALRSHLAQHGPASQPYLLHFADKTFQCSVHPSAEYFILSAEEPPEERSLTDAYQQTRQFLSYMEHTSSLQQLCDSVARGTRELTGYDRVMVYRFDEQYNGEIFAECKRDDLEPFLGLFYPHTDIPVQARELYLKNLLRIIPDINYTPVPVYTVDDREGKNLDMGESVLRSVSPIHVQYLQNMGVGATLTISLIYKGRLWGLIACHHYSAKDLSPAVRLAAQLQGHFITSQIDMRQANEEYELSRRSNEALQRLLSYNYESSRESFREIIADPKVLELCNASGACIVSRDQLYTYGKVPAEAEIRLIAEELSKRAGNMHYHTNQLKADVGFSDEYCESAAGVLYHSLSVSGNECVMWFRGETVTEVTWAGDPEKAIVKDEKGLHPRKSFEKWKEIVKCKSKPWLNPELSAAANYARILEKHVTYLTLAEEEEKYRKLNEVLKASNEELENVNWISAHDLQEPLRKIQLMSSRILATEKEDISPKTNDLVKRMNDSAHKMQNLLRSILDFVKVKNADRLMEPVDLNIAVQDALTELAENIAERKAGVEVDALPEIKAIPFLVKQLFVNLISNSLKFSDTERQPEIKIYAELVNGEEIGEPEGTSYHKITIADNGIGFDKQYAESIFRIFSRLNVGTEYHGSGVGLALCKKIMQSHEGFISAEGRHGKGAKFYLYFPKQ